MFFLARTVVKVLEGSKKMVCGWELDLKVQNSRKGWGGALRILLYMRVQIIPAVERWEAFGRG